LPHGNEPSSLDGVAFADHFSTGPSLISRREWKALVPWASASLLAGIWIGWLLPMGISQARQLHVRAQHLRQATGDPVHLRQERDSLDRALKADLALLGQASRRTAIGQDPASQAAALLLPVLHDNGWALEKVQTRAEAGLIQLDLSTRVPGYLQVVQGLERLSHQPLAVHLERMSIRTVEGKGMLLVDLRLSVPAKVAP